MPLNVSEYEALLKETPNVLRRASDSSAFSTSFLVNGAYPFRKYCDHVTKDRSHVLMKDALLDFEGMDAMLKTLRVSTVTNYLGLIRCVLDMSEVLQDMDSAEIESARAYWSKYKVPPRERISRTSDGTTDRTDRIAAAGTSGANDVDVDDEGEEDDEDDEEDGTECCDMIIQTLRERIERLTKENADLRALHASTKATAECQQAELLRVWDLLRAFLSPGGIASGPTAIALDRGQI